MNSRKILAGDAGKKSSKQRAAWVAAAILASLALTYAAYDYIAADSRLADPAPASACEDCAGAVGNTVRSTAARSRPHGLAALRDRVFSAIRQLITGQNPSSRRALDADDTAGWGLDALCTDGAASSVAQCSSYGFGRRSGRLIAATDRPSGPRAAISGRVMDAQGLGIQGVTVTMAPTRTYGQQLPGGGQGTLGRPTTTTDANGYYEFQGLPEGDYEVRTAALEAYGPARIAARSGVANADIVLVEQAPRMIEGRVVSPTGEPLEAVTVLPVLVGVPSVRTDASGNYQLPVPLKPGTSSLNVRFQLPGFLDHQAAVSLARTSALSGIALDVRMQPVEYWTNVSGVLKSAKGPPLAGRSVTLRQVGGQRSYRTVTDRRGRYVFDAVEAPLAYYLTVAGGPDHQDFRKRINVTTAAAELDVVVEPYEFGTLNGRLVNADGAPIPNFNLVLRNTASSSPNATVSSDEHGNFSIPMAPAGELVVASQSSPSILVKGLHLDPGAELDVPLVLDWGNHELRGVVLDRNNAPVPAARVLLTWSREEGGVITTTTRRARSDAQGTFYFGDLGPGPHLVQIDPPGHRRLEIAHDVTREGYSVTVNL